MTSPLPPYVQQQEICFCAQACTTSRGAARAVVTNGFLGTWVQRHSRHGVDGSYLMGPPQGRVMSRVVERRGSTPGRGMPSYSHLAVSYIVILGQKTFHAILSL